MVEIKITISSKLAELFVKATNHYNQKHETLYTNKDMIKKLAVDFIRDSLHEIKHIKANTSFKNELKDVPEYEN